MKSIIKRYFQNFLFFYKRLGYRVFIRMVLSLGVGLMDGFGLAMFLPLLQMVDHAKSSAKTMGNLGFIVKALNAIGVELNLMSVLSVISIFFVLKGVILYITSVYEVVVRQYFIKEIRVDLTKDFSKMAYKSFVTSNVGQIQNTMSGEVDRISLAYYNYFNAFQQFSLVVMYMVFAFFVDAKFAILISVGGALTNFVFRSIYTSTKRASGRLTKGTNDYQGLIIQYVANFKYLKATGSLKKMNLKLLKAIFDIENNNKKIGYLNSIVVATREPLLIFVVCTVIFLQVNVMGGALGTILISLLFFYRALSSLVVMQTFYNSFLAVSGSMDNLVEFQLELKNHKETNGSVTINKFEKDIILKNATFGYNDKLILDGINLEISRNQTVAFVGESGSGKTTLVNLLAGLMPLNRGEIYIDGININALDLESYQSRIGYITQEPVVFNDTVFNNVTFWDEATEQNKARFKEALRKASIDNYIEGRPEKEQTMLGNSGVNLSGGQKQRISIARELYKNIDILVLDEATSALDTETEKAIQENIENLKGRYTILIVAHRLSTIRNADKIVLLEGGRVKQSGSFSELYNSSEKFKNMVSLQEL